MQVGTDPAPKLSTRSLPFGGEEDLVKVVRWAARLAGTVAINIQPGQVTFIQLPGDTALEPTPKMPSDNLFERLQAGGNIEIKVMTRKGVRDAWFASMVELHRRGLFPTHLVGRDSRRICELLVLPPSLQSLAESRHVLGIEVLPSTDFDDDTVFLCGGPRKDGSVADINLVLRLEAGE